MSYIQNIKKALQELLVHGKKSFNSIKEYQLKIDEIPGGVLVEIHSDLRVHRWYGRNGPIGVGIEDGTGIIPFRTYAVNWGRIGEIPFQERISNIEFLLNPMGMEVEPLLVKINKNEN